MLSILDCSKNYSCSTNSALTESDRIKPKVYFSSSNSSNNSIIHSNGCFEKNNNDDFNSLIDSKYESIILSNFQNEEESTTQTTEITGDYKEENTLNTVNILYSSSEDIDAVSTNSCSESALGI